jgi:tetratricopeptide (TPR) repeat protein
MPSFPELRTGTTPSSGHPPAAEVVLSGGERAILSGLGLAVVLFIAAFAFLLGSFPARNSDVWMHLAAGRDLLPANLHTNPAWLYDLVTYVLYSVLGGAALVLVKALLVAALALVLMRLTWKDERWWIPAACIALALLAMSTRLLLQPATVSYLFLSLTLWFLRPWRAIPANRPPPLLPPWPLLLLFVVWVNVDRWFVLGLGTAALVCLGQSLDAVGSRQKAEGSGQEREGSRPLPTAYCLLPTAYCLLALAAVCLLNPSHVAAFALPPELAWSGFGGSSAGSLAPVQGMSPFEGAYFANVGLTPAGLAYFPLLGLGLLAFGLNLPGWRWQRFLPWLGLALLSIVQARAIPFFAVVAGPVLAWNLEEIFARWSRLAKEPSREGDRERETSLLAYVSPCVVVSLFIALLVCAWPGWLQSPPYEPRRWAIETAPALEQGAATTRRWQQEGKLADARGLHLSSATAHAFAWFCPEDKSVLDHGLASAVLGDSEEPEHRDERMRAAGLSYVIVYEPERGRLLAALVRLLASPERWPLLYLEGDLAVFGWRDPLKRESGDRFRGWELEVNRLAFHPEADKKAPQKPVARAAQGRRWWEAFWKPAPPRPIERDEATLHLLHAEALRRTAPLRHLMSWEATQSAALIAAAGNWTVPRSLPDAQLRLLLWRPPLSQEGAAAGHLSGLTALALDFRQHYNWQRDDTPPALLYLAVRAARRALAVNPNDAQAYLVIGESYVRLLHDTRERAWRGRLPELDQLRRAQATAALHQALSLKPDLAQAHFHLGTLYRDMGYLDLALKHLQAFFERTEEGATLPGPSGELLREQWALEEKQFGRLSETVAKLEQAYASESATLRVFDRATLAMRLGLAGKARDLLLESDIAAFGPQGMNLELELLVTTGRSKQVREWTEPVHKASLGAKAYHWLRLQAAAALGAYAAAEKECAQLVLATRSKNDPGAREMMAREIGGEILDGLAAGAFLPDLLWRTYRWDFRNRIARLTQSARQEADAITLGGLLALEAGAVDEAKSAFRAALRYWQDEAAVVSGRGLDFGGRIIAQECLRWLPPFPAAKDAERDVHLVQ